MERAKIFWSGRSQAVRLPKDFRFTGEEVRIRPRQRSDSSARGQGLDLAGLDCRQARRRLSFNLSAERVVKLEVAPSRRRG